MSATPLVQEHLGREVRNPRTLRTGRLLVAEDDGEMRKLLASTLRRDGYEVIEASDGRELIEQFEASLRAGTPVDLVVTDIRMPKLSGLQVLQFLRAAKHLVPIILITAFGDHATHIEAWLQGAVFVFDKPFELDELRRLVRSQLTRTPTDDL